MASNGTPTFPDPNELTVREALVIVGAVVALMVVLVILRFSCNIWIDLCILEDYASARRQVRNCWNRFCLCCPIRERPPDDNNGMELVDLNALMLRLSPDEKNALFDSILKTKVSFHPVQYLRNLVARESA